MAGSDTQPEAWTIARVLTWAAKDFKERGLDSPRLEAEMLLADALGTNRMQLILDAMRPLEKSELGAYRALLRRRREHEPVAYILGEREFYGLSFKVDSRVLIPRPDTESLVEAALERSDARDLHGALLDLCTGSGCVALAFAKQRPTWTVWASDRSADALAVAQDNALRLGCATSVRFVESDLFESVADHERFEVITANPPYIPTSDCETLMRDVRDHEPRMALDGGGDGFDIIRRLVPEALKRLASGGILAIEVGDDQADGAVRIFEESGFADVRRHQDYRAVNRVVSGVGPQSN
jgi:release factor glutamine methyltransferase